MSPPDKPEGQQSDFAEYSGVITQKQKPHGNEKKILRRNFLTYLKNSANLEDEILFKGGRSVTPRFLTRKIFR
jgi:hypothetical protein